MAFEKGNTYGNRFSSTNQPKKNGRKPSLYTYLKKKTGRKVTSDMTKENYYEIMQYLMERSPNEIEMLVKTIEGDANRDTPLWVINILSAINADIRYGKTDTLQALFNRLFNKASQPIEANIEADINGMDLSALSTDELIEFNKLTEKIRKSNR